MFDGIVRRIKICSVCQNIDPKVLFQGCASYGLKSPCALTFNLFSKVDAFFRACFINTLSRSQKKEKHDNIFVHCSVSKGRG